MTTIIYVTSGAWGAGTGTPNSAAQVDGNFYNLDQRVVGLVADLAEGKRIDHVTYSANSMTFYYTDGTSQIIPLPVATLTYVGEWMNSKTYVRGNMVSYTPLGIFQVLQDHISPPPPTPFDPNARDGSGNLLYQMFMPLQDVNYDAAVFVPGSIQRDPDELLWQGVANRAMRLPVGNADCYAYLDVGNNASGATDIILSIEKNDTEIGTITFAAGGTIDTTGGQTGTFSILADADFISGDRYTLRVTQSDNVMPAALSVTLPFLRMDI
jgi:hypothetical protein